MSGCVLGGGWLDVVWGEEAAGDSIDVEET